MLRQHVQHLSLCLFLTSGREHRENEPCSTADSLVRKRPAWRPSTRRSRSSVTGRERAELVIAARPGDGRTGAVLAHAIGEGEIELW